MDTMYPQRGAVLILVLWMVVIITLIVGVVASEVRLSAKAAYYHKQGVQQWADVLSAFQYAQMELMIQRMPQPPQPLGEEALSEREKTPLFLFDGRALTLSYPNAPSNMEVRIFDHAGLINLKQLDAGRFRKLLEFHLGEPDLEKINALYDAWLDWRDPDDLKRLNGAEKEFYQKQKPPYTPRNGEIESVEEILLIKGFEEVFANTNLHALFTVYGVTGTGINPNYATVEALALVPGIDAKAAAHIVELRQEEVLKSAQDFAEFLSADKIIEATPWLQFSISTANYYTILITPKPNSELPPTTQRYGFMAIVRLQSYTTPPNILYVNPFVALPNRDFEQPELIEEE